MIGLANSVLWVYVGMNARTVLMLQEFQFSGIFPDLTFVDHSKLDKIMLFKWVLFVQIGNQLLFQVIQYFIQYFYSTFLT